MTKDTQLLIHYTITICVSTWRLRKNQTQSLTVLCICCPSKKPLSTKPVFSWPPTKVNVKVIYHKSKTTNKVFDEIFIILRYCIFNFGKLIKVKKKVNKKNWKGQKHIKSIFNIKTIKLSFYLCFIQTTGTCTLRLQYCM